VPGCGRQVGKVVFADPGCTNYLKPSENIIAGLIDLRRAKAVALIGVFISAGQLNRWTIGFWCWIISKLMWRAGRDNTNIAAWDSNIKTPHFAGYNNLDSIIAANCIRYFAHSKSHMH